eukprot:TRINITY_DN1661_c0_g1_i1.p2 TRINITY_DN1661_c0_g1~~TRINITY_DN1661_c0_g1_i1.p2  ORF type:complete len:958 (+),score=215.12 TRINITY_DN1661_c0_g1_i1:119-2875(+)
MENVLSFGPHLLLVKSPRGLPPTPTTVFPTHPPFTSSPKPHALHFFSKFVPKMETFSVKQLSGITCKDKHCVYASDATASQFHLISFSAEKSKWVDSGAIESIHVHPGHRVLSCALSNCWGGTCIGWLSVPLHSAEDGPPPAVRSSFFCVRWVKEINPSEGAHSDSCDVVPQSKREGISSIIRWKGITADRLEDASVMEINDGFGIFAHGKLWFWRQGMFQPRNVLDGFDRKSDDDVLHVAVHPHSKELIFLMRSGLLCIIAWNSTVATRLCRLSDKIMDQKPSSISFCAFQLLLIACERGDRGLVVDCFNGLVVNELGLPRKSFPRLLSLVSVDGHSWTSALFSNNYVHELMVPPMWNVCKKMEAYDEKYHVLRMYGMSQLAEVHRLLEMNTRAKVAGWEDASIPISMSSAEMRRSKDPLLRTKSPLEYGKSAFQNPLLSYTGASTLSEIVDSDRIAIQWCSAMERLVGDKDEEQREMDSLGGGLLPGEGEVSLLTGLNEIVYPKLDNCVKEDLEDQITRRVSKPVLRSHVESEEEDPWHDLDDDLTLWAESKSSGSDSYEAPSSDEIAQLMLHSVHNPALVLRNVLETGVGSFAKPVVGDNLSECDRKFVERKSFSWENPFACLPTFGADLMHSHSHPHPHPHPHSRQRQLKRQECPLIGEAMDTDSYLLAVLLVQSSFVVCPMVVPLLVALWSKHDGILKAFSSKSFSSAILFWGPMEEAPLSDVARSVLSILPPEIPDRPASKRREESGIQDETKDTTDSESIHLGTIARAILLAWGGFGSEASRMIGDHTWQSFISPLLLAWEASGEADESLPVDMLPDLMCLSSENIFDYLTKLKSAQRLRGRKTTEGMVVKDIKDIFLTISRKFERPKSYSKLSQQLPSTPSSTSSPITRSMPSPSPLQQTGRPSFFPLQK